MRPLMLPGLSSRTVRWRRHSGVRWAATTRSTGDCRDCHRMVAPGAIPQLPLIIFREGVRTGKSNMGLCIEEDSCIHLSEHFHAAGCVLPSSAPSLAKHRFSRRRNGVRITPSIVPSRIRRSGDRSIERFKTRVRQITNRRNPKTLEALWTSSTPSSGVGTILYRPVHVRRLFHRLDGWIVRRIWSWCYKQCGVEANASKEALRGTRPGQPPAADAQHGELLPRKGRFPVRAACGRTTRAVRKGGRRQRDFGLAASPTR